MLLSHCILGALWITFCVLHSVLADTGVKRKLTATTPRFSKNYRFFYTIFAFVSLFVVVYYQLYLTTPYMYSVSMATEFIGAVLALVGIGIMLICIKKYFLSLSGIKSLFAEQIINNQLRIDGIHRFVRHPLYLGTFIFIWGFWIFYPILSLFISNVIITIYTIIGIRLEEKKLIEEFGESYVGYRKKVPMLFPLLKKQGNK